MQTTTHTTSRSNQGLVILGLVMSVSLFFSCAAKSKEEPVLDGRVFTVLTIPDGNSAEAAMERISFTNGKFDNDNCHLWGFGDGAYAAKEAGDSIAFTATTTSAKEGTMTWTGVIKGTTLMGTMVWSKEGQSDLNYHFTSANIEEVDLNGISFAVQFSDGDTAQAETITFNNGMFESPGCYTYGFSASPYQAYMLDGKQHFQCLYTSAKEGKMLFYGVIDGTSISGTQFWTKEGQDDVYYKMSGQKL